MPRGVPKSGVRMTRKRRAMIDLAPTLPLEVSHETDAQIEQKLNDRFDILEEMTLSAVAGDVRALIVSGPGGLGKSFTVDKALDCLPRERWTAIRGTVNKTGLFKTLYQYRHPGNVIVFDDADRIFFDDDCLNLLKAACDTMKTREISYLSEFKLVDEDTSEVIPRQFVFEGTVIFITNQDFDTVIASGSKIAPHMEALITRSHYIDLAMKTRRDYLIRIRQVVNQGMLRDQGLNKQQEQEVLDFIDENQDKLRELSLRMALKLSTLMKTSKDWRRTARVTCCKGVA